MNESPDVLIVGGGPAGLAAADAAVHAGLTTTIVEEASELGGQYFRQAPPALRATADHRPEGRRLIDQVTAGGADVLVGAAVWGVDGRGVLVAPRRGGKTRRLEGRYLIVATGAHELVLPFPGWQSPGVVTPGFALHTAVTEGVPISGSVLVAGTGPFLLVVANELLSRNVNVVGVSEESTLRPTLGRVARAAGHVRRLGQLGRLAGGLVRHRVPWWRGTRLVALTPGANGQHVAQLATRGPGRARSWDVQADLICAAFGFRPNSELPELLGCALGEDAFSGIVVPTTDAHGRTTVDRVYAIGDGAGIGGAEQAMVQGRLAIADISRREGRPVQAQRARRELRQVKRLESFGRLHAEVFPAPLERMAELPGDTTVCRCEAVTADAIRTADRSAWHDLSGLKAATRAGMGLCQGRECRTAVAALAGHAAARGGAWNARMPLRPLTIGSVASLVACPTAPPFSDGAGTSVRRRRERPMAGPSPAFSTDTADVIIVGAGVVGAATAWRLSRDKLRVRVLEQGAVNRMGSGTTAGNLHIQAIHSHRPGQQVAVDVARFLPLQKSASDLWDQMSDELGRDISLRRTGGLTVAETEDDVAALRTKLVLEHAQGIPSEFLDESELRKSAPELGQSVRAATWCPWDGYADPLKVTLALLDAAQSEGARVDPFSQVQSLTRNGAGWRVGTARGAVSGAMIVNAAGPEMAAVSSLAGITMAAAPVQMQMHISARVPPLLPRLIQHTRLGLSVKQVATGQILIGGGWPAAHPTEPTRTSPISLTSLAGNLELASRVIPDLEHIDLIRTWTGQVLTAIDEMPVIGEAADGQGFYVCGGTYAFTLAPLWAEVLRSMVLGETPPLDVGDLAPSRLFRESPNRRVPPTLEPQKGMTHE